MKNLKKVLAVLLSIVMVFSLAVSSFAASYITKAQARQAAVDAVNAKFNTSYTVDGVIFDRVERAEFDDDYLKYTYEVEFYVDNGDGTYKEYNCDIDAKTGELLGRIEHEIERDPTEIPGNSGIVAFFAKIKAFFSGIFDAIKKLFKA